MSQGNAKTPPVLTDEGCYQTWVRDVKVWRMLTELKKEKHGPAIYLSLSGKSRDAVSSIEPDDIGKVDGADKIIAKLDEVFLKDKTTRSYLAFKAFYNYRRTSGMPITEFVVGFEKHNNEMKKYEMTLPDSVLAFMMLIAANIEDDMEKLARATVTELKYDTMKDMRKSFKN